MQADPSVAQALNDTLLLEITFFEVTHAQEHVWKRKKYKGLRDWYDGQVHDSRERRRWLTDRLFKLDAPATIAMRSTTVSPADTPEAILAATLTAAQELLSSYQSGYVTAESAGDNVTADEFCSQQKNVESLVGCLEAFAGQIDDMGISEFLGEMM
jgi:bacterioferritin (cytochrome b1)